MRNEVRTFSLEKGISRNQVQDTEVKDLNPRPRTSVGSNPSAAVMSIRTHRFGRGASIEGPFALRQKYINKKLAHCACRKSPNFET